MSHEELLAKMRKAREAGAKEIAAITKPEKPDPFRFEIPGLGRLEQDEPVSLEAIRRLMGPVKDRYNAPDPLAVDPLKRLDLRQAFDSQAGYDAAKAAGLLEPAHRRIAELEAQRRANIAAHKEAERQGRIAARRQKAEQEAAAVQAQCDVADDANDQRLSELRDGGI